MKKILISLLVLMFATLVFAFPSAQDARGTFRNGYAWGGHSSKDRATQWAQGIEGLAMISSGLGTGKIFYVDSNVNGTSGQTWADAVGTFDAAVDLSSADGGASRGDFILMAQGHAETVNEVDEVDIDVAGITALGFGRGSLKPTFTYTVAAGEIVIGAPNVSIQNIRCVTSVTAVLIGVDVEATGDNALIQNVEFIQAADATTIDEFNVGINVTSAADNVSVIGCWMNSGKAQAVDAILIGTVSGFHMANTTIFGDYSTAVIKNVGASDNVIIRNSIIYNGNMTEDGGLNSEPALEMAEGTSGFVLDNRIASDVASTLLMRIADDMTFMNNFVTDSDGDEFSGTIEAGHVYGAISSVSGHNDG